MRDRLTESAAFAVNILRRDQEDLSQRFATPGPKSLEGVRAAYSPDRRAGVS